METDIIMIMTGTGDTSTGYWHPGYYYDPLQYPLQYWSPGYPTYIHEKSKVDQAFKILQILIEKKMLIKDLDIKEFAELVNELSKEL